MSCWSNTSARRRRRRARRSVGHVPLSEATVAAAVDDVGGLAVERRRRFDLVRRRRWLRCRRLNLAASGDITRRR